MIITPGTDRVKSLIPTLYESPFASKDFDTFAGNIAYLRMVKRNGALLHNEAGFGSHGVWTQPGVFQDSVPAERALGIDCCLAFAELAYRGVMNHVFCVDRGWTNGMLLSKRRSEGVGGTFIVRSLKDELGEEEFNRQYEETRSLIEREQWEWFDWSGWEHESAHVI